MWDNPSPPAVSTEDVKGEKDAGKEAKAAKEEIAKGNGKPPAERPRFMFNIADGGFTGESRSSRSAGFFLPQALGRSPPARRSCEKSFSRVFIRLSVGVCSVLQSCTLSGRTRSGPPSPRGR